MKDFLFIIRTEGSVFTDLPEEALQKHMKNGQEYIGGLIQDGTLKAANPIDQGSKIISKEEGSLKDGPYNEAKEVIAGFFHVQANDMNSAIEIAKANPIFDDIPTKIEVHPLMPVGA